MTNRTSCRGTHFLYLSNPPSGNLLPIIPCDQAYLGVHIRSTHKESINTYLQILEAAEEASGTDEVKPEEAWCYQCRFVCCQTVFSQKWRFDRHVGATHGITTSEFFDQMRGAPGYFLRKQFHKCRVCGKEILFDKSPIQVKIFLEVNNKIFFLHVYLKILHI